MKGNGFGDKARRLGEWFQDWNSCEQTIALYSLLSKVSATQARFLSLVLEHSLKNGCDSQELSKLESQANSSSYLKSLHSNTEEEALSQLLSHLPLLNPGNTEARSEYMKLLTKVMLGSSDEVDYFDQCRQLLSLALVHPAFPHEDREALTFWLSQLDTKHKDMAERQSIGSASLPQRPPALPPRIRQIRNIEECGTSLSNGRIYIEGDLNHTLHDQDTPSYSSDPYNADDEEVQRIGLSNTLPRGGSPFGFGSNDISSSFPSSYEDKVVFRERSSTIPRVASKEDKIPSYEPGMKDVPVWLKSLRLHKYQSLFNNLTYEEMLNMKEEYLQAKKVTKGARNKLILCIRKLAQRPETLHEIEQDMDKHGHLLHCFNELRQMLQTPIKPYNNTETHSLKKKLPQLKPVEETSGSGDEDEEGAGGRPRSPASSSPQAHHSSSDCGSDLEELLAKSFPGEDLSSLLTRAMGKGFSQLMLHIDTNEDNLSAYIKLVDAALQHEAFTLEQKKLFFDWKQQCNQTLRVLSSKKNSRGRQYGSAYTMPATPRGQIGSGYPLPPGSAGLVNKGRSLRGGAGVSTRNVGSLMGGKGVSLPGSTRTCSTLPRMSARQLQQPIPHNIPSFLRPNSTINYPVIPILPGQQQQHEESFQTNRTLPSTSSLVMAPPPLPPRGCDVSEVYMDELCKSVTDHVLPDDLSDN